MKKNNCNLLKIFIIDDEADILEIFSEHLTDLGHEVITARSYKEALMMASEHRFDIILCDSKLGDDSRGPAGDLVVKEIKEQFEFNGPCYLMSGNGIPTEAADHITGHFEKPFDLDELVSALLRS